MTTPHPETDLRDAHLHLAEHGENLRAIHLDGCADLESCLARIAQGARDTPDGPGAWVIARGARIESWPERRFPTARELDDAAGGRPVMVASFDFHSASASSEALRCAGCTRDTPDPPGGLIQRDARGEPTGVLLESAYKRLLAALPPVSDARYAEHILAAQQDLVDRGFIEVHDMMATVRLARALDALDRAGRLRVSVTLYAKPDAFDEVRAWFAAHHPSERIRFGGLKLFTDGTLNSRTASMLHPYADPIPAHPRGTPMLTDEELDASFRRAAEEGFDVAAHAIGDGAVRSVLDSYERIAPVRRFLLRIEHAEYIDEADVPRFARLGVVASIQPCHLLTDIEAILRLTPDRAHRAFPIRDLAESARSAGRDPRELIWFGSDTPVVPPSPVDNIQAAVHRTRAVVGDVRAPAIAPNQAIEASLAWDCMRSTIATPQRRASASSGATPAPRRA